MSLLLLSPFSLDVWEIAAAVAPESEQVAKNTEENIEKTLSQEKSHRVLWILLQQNTALSSHVSAFLKCSKKYSTQICSKKYFFEYFFEQIFEAQTPMKLTSS